MVKTMQDVHRIRYAAQMYSLDVWRILGSCDGRSFSLSEREERIQSTLVISKSKGPSETLRDIRSSTYQMCRIEENTNRTTKFHK